MYVIVMPCFSKVRMYGYVACVLNRHEGEEFFLLRSADLGLLAQGFVPEDAQVEGVRVCLYFYRIAL